MPVAETPPTETPPKKTMRRWYELKLAERAAMLCYQAKDRQLLNRLTLKAQNGTVGKEDPTVDRLLEADDMQVRIGDEIRNYYSEEPKPEVSASIGSLSNKLLFAALLGTGIVIGGVFSWLAGASNMQPIAPPAVGASADDDTLYELRFGD